jgi:hypothetical protein
LASGEDMTNEITGTLEIVTRDPLSPITVAWVVVAILMPLISVVAYVKHWLSTRQGNTPYWAPRFILLSAFLIFVFTVIEITSRVQLVLYVNGTMEMGAAQWAMTSIALSHCCWVFAFGVISTSFCICARLLLPPTKRNEKCQQGQPG